MDFSYNSTQNICPAVHIAFDNEYLYKNKIATDAGLKINAVASEVFESFQEVMENVKTLVNGFTPNEFNPLNKTHYKLPRAEKPVQVRPANGVFLLGFVVMFGIFTVAVERLAPAPGTLARYMGLEALALELEGQSPDVGRTYYHRDHLWKQVGESLYPQQDWKI